MSDRFLRAVSRVEFLSTVLMILAVGVAPAAGEDPPGLAIPEYGVGKEVVDRELKGKGDTFAEGEQVCFWTRVTGGQAGDRIQHVWIHEGEERVTVGLSIGGDHWRTYSRKFLHPGSVGKWVVEARDAEGNVLARAEFSCVPPGDTEEVPTPPASAEREANP